MSGYSGSGFRGKEHNTFYFEPYDGKQFDSKPITHLARYPYVVTSDKTYRRRTTRGTIYDVRATYPEDHVLRTAIQTHPTSLPRKASLSDLFLKAHAVEDDNILPKMQEEGLNIKEVLQENATLNQIKEKRRASKHFPGVKLSEERPKTQLKDTSTTSSVFASTSPDTNPDTEIEELEYQSYDIHCKGVVMEIWAFLDKYAMLFACYLYSKFVESVARQDTLTPTR